MKNMDEQKLNNLIELIVVILMGVTALLTAWASWIGSLHGGNQATNYTISNNLASEGNSEYNAGSQYLMQDMLLWNDIADMQFDISAAYYSDSEDPLVYEELELMCEKLYFKLAENLNEDMAAAIAWTFPDTNDYVDTIMEWMEDEAAINSPFGDEALIETYFYTANELLAESSEILEQGKLDNSNGDSFGLVTVIYSISLFLLGIVGTIKNLKNRYALIAIAFVCILGSTIFMLSIPLPTGFSLSNFF